MPRITSHIPKPHSPLFPFLPGTLLLLLPPHLLSLSIPIQPKMKGCFSCLENMVLRCREAVSFRVFSQTRDSGNGLVFRVMKSAVFAAFTCIFALGMDPWSLLLFFSTMLPWSPKPKGHGVRWAVYNIWSCRGGGFAGGAVVGTITGAIKGQTTETGFFRGSGIGAVTGAITALQLLESVAAGESLSKVTIHLLPFPFSIFFFNL